MTKQFEWPKEIYRGAVAVVGKVGSGKTFTVKGAIEFPLEAGARVCILDPTGAWWGLKSSADGKREGFPVAVFGGEHGDVAIDATPETAEKLGEIIADKPLQTIIDLSLMSMGGRTRFMTRFLETLYHHQRAVTLHLVIDEADMFAPQRPLPDQTVMLNRVEQIVRRGRIKGFRPWLITQRPAELHKSVLSQAATLIAMKLTAPQDRDAIGAWIEGQADRNAGKALLADLPKLPVGEGYVWCPSADILQRCKFPKIKTFDSSRTPEDGEVIEQPHVLARADMAELERLLAPPPPAEEKKGVTISVSSDRTAYNEAIDAAERRGYDAGVEAGRKAALSGAYVLMEETSRKAVDALGPVFRAALGDIDGMHSVKTVAYLDTQPPLTLAKPLNGKTGTQAAATAAMSGAARKVLSAIHAAYPQSLTYAAAAARAAISKRSSAYRKYRTEIIASGEIEMLPGDRFKSFPRFAAPMPATGDPVEDFAGRLQPAYANMLRVIAKQSRSRPGDPWLTRDQIAERANVSRTSSGLGAGLRELLALELIAQQRDAYALHHNLGGPQQ